jgi:hypothetical protein
MDKRWVLLLILSIVLLILVYYRYSRIINKIESMVNNEKRNEYIQQFIKKENRMFPFRYFTDELGNVLPIVAVTGFFRGKDAEDKYNEYLKEGIFIFGITAYKSFPNKELLDKSEGEYERNDDFNYISEIKDWLCCFKNKEKYGFLGLNNIIDISESDFYNIEKETTTTKKYDFIYICNKDSDTCPMDGWNSINRNFDLAKKCFPILCNEFGLKGLVVGREGCGLEKDYSGKLEVTGWLDWHTLQTKMRESRILFVPNIFDASPRVIAECIIKDLTVLMNKNILCGSKYITYDTGEFFTDEIDIRPALTNILNKEYKISPKKWWNENYSHEISEKKLCIFLKDCFPVGLENINRVKFIL